MANGIDGTTETEKIPEGNYLMVTWDASTTGRRLIDELVHLGAYAPGLKPFSEYIMPYSNLSLSSSRMYNLRVIDNGRYRYLKDTSKNKLIKSKSEVTALQEFLEWLDQAKKSKPDCDAVVLVYHEHKDVHVLMLVQALQRYKLLDQFCSTVKGFANSYPVVEHLNVKSGKPNSLRGLVATYLSKDQDYPMEGADARAQALYTILLQLYQEHHKSEGPMVNVIPFSFVQEESFHVSHAVDELEEVKLELEKESHFRPVFLDMFREGFRQRRRAGVLRRLLVDAGLDYESICASYKDGGKDTVADVLKDKIAKHEKDVQELIDLFSHHFEDPKPTRVGRGINGSRRGPRTKSLCDEKVLKEAALAEVIVPEKAAEAPQ